MPQHRGGRFILHTSGFLLFPNIMKEPETLSLQEKKTPNNKKTKSSGVHKCVFTTLSMATTVLCLITTVSLAWLPVLGPRGCAHYLVQCERHGNPGRRHPCVPEEKPEAQQGWTDSRSHSWWWSRFEPRREKACFKARVLFEDHDKSAAGTHPLSPDHKLHRLSTPRQRCINSPDASLPQLSLDTPLAISIISL